MKVDGHVICYTGGESIAEYLARLDQGGIMSSKEVVIKDRVGIRFTGKGIGSIVGGVDRETAIGDNKFKRIDHIQE